MSAEPIADAAFSIEYEGQAVELAHLDGFDLEFGTQARPLGVRIRVRFSTHCYSETFDEAEHGDRPVVMDHNDRKRAFCPVRHEMSKQLPDLVRGLPDSHVFMTPEGNYVRITLGEGVEYRMFFNLRKAGEKVEADLSLYVESAYAPTQKVLAASAMQKVRFKVLVDKVLSGGKLKFNRRR